MASGLTPLYLIPYPLATDPVDVHGDVQDLAERVDIVLNTKIGTDGPNTFTFPQIIDVTSTSTALRVTQTGTGNVVLFEDSSNPDTTPFVIDNGGNVGIGLTTPTEKLDVVGNIKTTGNIIFEGTDDANELILTTADPAGDYTVTIPSKTGTIAFTNDKLSVFASTTSSELAGIISDETGTGALVFASSPALAGTPTSTTAAVDTNTTQIATTAFVLAQASAANPAALGSVAIGTSTRYARADHVHPTTGLGLTSGTLGQFAATTSSALAGVISDETGTGSLVFSTAPTFTGLVTINTANASGVGLLVKASAAQTANIQEWQNSSGTVRARIASGGAIYSLGGFYSGFIASEAAPTTSAYLQFASNSAKIITQTTNATSFIVVGETAQTANLQEWQAVGGTILSSVNISGHFSTPQITINSAGEFRLADSDSSNYVGFKSPATVGTNLIWTLPSADGSNGQVLSTNGSGTLSWVTAAGGGTTTNALTIGTGLSGTSFNGSAAVTIAIDSTVATLDGSQALTNKTINASNNTITNVSLTTAITGTLPVANGGTGITSFGTGVATWLGTPSSANLAAAVTDETGTGALVFASSPALAGTPTSTTAAVDTNTTQIATTAFVLAQASAANPAALGSVAIGTSTRYARADHVHPTTGLGLTSGTLGQFAATTSSALAGVISDETGSGALVFGTSPTIVTPTLTLSSTTSTTAGRIAFNATSDKIIIGDGTNEVEFASSTLITNAQTVAYTLVLADKDKLVEINSGSAVNLTVPTDSVAFPVGSQVNILQTGSGQVTIVGDGGVTVNGTPGLIFRAQWSSVTLIKRGSNNWVAIGDLSA